MKKGQYPYWEFNRALNREQIYWNKEVAREQTDFLRGVAYGLKLAWLLMKKFAKSSD